MLCEKNSFDKDTAVLKNAALWGEPPIVSLLPSGIVSPRHRLENGCAFKAVKSLG
jgi:hypothetical protein